MGSSILQANGDSVKLAEEMSDQEIIRYYRTFRPDARFRYYDVEFQVRRQTIRDGREFAAFVPEARFEILRLRYEDHVDTLNIGKMLQREWTYSGQRVVGIEPIPILPSARAVFADMRVIVRLEEGLPAEDTIDLSLEVKRMRKLKTPLNWGP